MVTKENVLPGEGIKDRLRVLRKKDPAPGESLDPVFAYCRECEDLALMQIEEVLIRQHPMHTIEIRDGVSWIKLQQEIMFPKNRLSIVDGVVMYSPATGRNVRVSPILETIYFTNPDLAVLPYVACFYPAQKSTGIHEKYLNSSKLFTDIVEAGKIDDCAPEAKIMALVCMTEAGKDYAVGNYSRWGDRLNSLGSVWELVEYATMFGGVGEDKLSNYFALLKRKVDRLRLHVEFLNFCQRTISDIAKEADLQPDQVKLLVSLMHMRKDYVPVQSGFTDLIGPIAQFIQARDWVEAQRYMDFLVGSFPNAFPQWVKNGRALPNGQIGEPTPALTKYQKAVESIVSKIELPTEEERRVMVRKGAGLASVLLRELARETKMHTLTRTIVHSIGKDATPLILDLFARGGDFERYEQIRKKSGHIYEGASMQNDYERHRKSYKDAIAEPDQFELLLPERKTIENVEFVNGGLVYWCKASDVEEFGTLLFKLIRLACDKKYPTKVLDIDQLKLAFKRAYHMQLARDFSMEVFTLGQFITAFILDGNHDLRLSENVNIAKFLMELD